MSRHVLVPVDDSERAREALTFALEEYADAEITVLHVISPTSVFAVSEPAAWDDRLLERRREDAEELLAELRDEARARGADVRTEIEYGNAPRTIIEYAGENGVDQIVIGSHGRTGVSRVLLGSVRKSGGFSSQTERSAFCWRRGDRRPPGPGARHRRPVVEKPTPRITTGPVSSNGDN